MSNFALAMQPPPIMRQLDWQRYGTGASQDIASIREQAEILSNDYRESTALTFREEIIAETFEVLAERWRNETRFESSLPEIVRHPAYRAIVALGDEVVPRLLAELRRRPAPEPWFVALREITRADPVLPDHWGDMIAMADDWLRWGRAHRLIW